MGPLRIGYYNAGEVYNLYAAKEIDKNAAGKSSSCSSKDEDLIDEKKEVCIQIRKNKVKLNSVFTLALEGEKYGTLEVPQTKLQQKKYVKNGQVGYPEAFKKFLWRFLRDNSHTHKYSWVTVDNK